MEAVSAAVGKRDAENDCLSSFSSTNDDGDEVIVVLVPPKLLTLHIHKFRYGRSILKSQF